MSSKKPPVKAKPAPKKATAKPASAKPAAKAAAKKAAPAKPASKPASKKAPVKPAAKPAAVKSVAKPASSKPAVKSATKNAAPTKAPSKAVPKKNTPVKAAQTKSASKPAAAKTTTGKATAAKPVATTKPTAAKSVAKSTAKPVAKQTEKTVSKNGSKPAPKKETPAKVESKATSKKPAKAAGKDPSKPISKKQEPVSTEGQGVVEVSEKGSKPGVKAAAKSEIPYAVLLSGGKKLSKTIIFFEIDEQEERANKKKVSSEVKNAEKKLPTCAIRHKHSLAEETQEELTERILKELEEQNFAFTRDAASQICTRCNKNVVSPEFWVDKHLGYCEECALILKLGMSKEARKVEYQLGAMGGDSLDEVDEDGEFEGPNAADLREAEEDLADFVD
ncbi:MAG: hypothetical protein HUK21_02475 [Fibrobacteraceae bacterium]|nr:hypothetical protein [Fibrobacteraceae bacterium]